MRRNQEDSRFKKSLISRFKRGWIQDSREDEFNIKEKKSRRLHKGSIEKIFQKPNIAQFCLSKEFFSKFFKLLDYLLSGNRLPITCNRLPITCNRLPVVNFDFKSF